MTLSTSPGWFYSLGASINKTSYPKTSPTMSVRLVLVLCVSLAIVCGSAGDLGVVSLDEIIFDKLISRFNVSLVKFDTAFPYGEKHDQYAKFAREQNVLVKDLLIADVHTKGLCGLKRGI